MIRRHSRSVANSVFGTCPLGDHFLDVEGDFFGRALFSEFREEPLF